MCPDCLKQTPRPSVNLTDVTLADKETNLILTDKVNRVIQGNVAMQVRKSYLVRKIYLVRKSYSVRESYPVQKYYPARKSFQ